jgi:hypothetical protein
LIWPGFPIHFLQIYKFSYLRVDAGEAILRKQKVWYALRM